MASKVTLISDKRKFTNLINNDNSQANLTENEYGELFNLNENY